MTPTVTPITCPECKVLPTQHICGVCKTNYVCDLCSQRRGVAEGIFRCQECVPGVHDVVCDAIADNDDGSKGGIDEGEVFEAVQIGDISAISNTDETNREQDVVASTNPAPELDSEFDCRVLERPNRLNKKMGKNAIVSVKLKNILPINQIKERYPNDYKEKRCHFIVGDIKKMKVTHRNGDTVIIVLTLKFKSENDDPRTIVPSTEFHWHARYSNCRLERPGPPNQLFFSKNNKANTQIEPSTRNQSRIQPQRRRDDQDASLTDAEHSDPESDLENNDEERGIDPQATDRYFIEWQDNFMEHVTIDNRQLRGCSKAGPSLNGFLQTKYEFLSASSFFMVLCPTKYFEEHLIPATNKELSEMHEKDLTLGEFFVWLGVWFLISLNPGYSPKDFFSTKQRDMYWNPSFLGSAMSGKRFQRLGEAIRLNNDPPPHYKDRFFG